MRTTKVSNPLTIIAIFAGLSEISGTTVLPFLQETNQAIFLWFVMLFPFVLVVLFFLILWKKHFVLYAPSDYQQDSSFLTAARVQGNTYTGPVEINF